MESLVKVLADSGNLAVIVLMIANAGLLWMCRYLLQSLRDQSASWSAAEKANAETDLKLAEALTALKTVVERCTNR